MAVVGEFGAAKAELVKEQTGEPDTIMFFGESFEIAADVGVMPLLDFAAAANEGIDSNEMKGLSAMRALLQDCLAEGEWDRFHASAMRNKADADLLMGVCARVYEVISGRPTESPTGSAGGQSTSSPSSSPSATRRELLGLVPVEQAMGLTG